MGWPGGRYHVHMPHICVLPLPLPARMFAGPGRGAVADCAAQLCAADSRHVAGHVGCAVHAGSAAVKT